jgi:hypothetical protein
MAKGKKHLSVPLLSPYAIKLAELCAIDLWNGVDYETGKPIDASDDELLLTFYLPIKRMYLRGASSNTITEDDVRLIIKQGKLKALYRSHLPLDFNKGLNAIKSQCLPIYKGWRNGTMQLTPTGYATKASLELGISFVQTSKAPTRNGNYRVPLSTRILFYALPDMLMFNYSNALGKALNLQSRPQSAIPYFFEIMSKGLEKNAKELAKLKMPSSVFLSQVDWARIKKHGWWERRVLDLALMIHFKLSTPRIDLQRLARQLAKQAHQKNQAKKLHEK